MSMEHNIQEKTNSTKDIPCDNKKDTKTILEYIGILNFVISDFPVQTNNQSLIWNYNNSFYNHFLYFFLLLLFQPVRKKIFLLHLKVFRGIILPYPSVIDIFLSGNHWNFSEFLYKTVQEDSGPQMLYSGAGDWGENHFQSTCT